MKFYLASSFKRKQQLETIKNELESLGHVIPDVWWNIDSKDDEMTNRDWHSLPTIKAIAIRHWKSIAECDALILISSEFEYTPFNGANIEVGYAIGKGLPVFTYRLIAKSAMYAPTIECLNLDELLDAINIFEYNIQR